VGWTPLAWKVTCTKRAWGQLYVRLLTDNFEEATAARKEQRVKQAFRDKR
jgi:Enoyl-CoA hydratase (EC 4.2.1.17)